MVASKQASTDYLCRHPVGCPGFTLVELVVVLVIIGALAVVTAPVYFTRQTFEARGFFEETLASVRYAQKLAVASGCTVRVEITATGYSLWRAAGGPPGCNAGPFTTAVADPTGQPAFTRSAPSGVTLGALDFTFSPLGVKTPTVDSNVVVNPGGLQFRIWGMTGFVQRL